MSYEGYQQCLCPQGHLFERDEPYDWADNAQTDTCPYGCSGAPIWINYVDQTNGPSEGVIPIALFKPLELTPASQTHCTLCHSVTNFVPATYRMPTPAEHKAMRRRKVYQDGAWVTLPEDS